MANIIYGDIVVELKGSVNGRTYQKTKYGFTQRRRVKPVNPNSFLQQLTRSTITALSRQWAALSESSRLAWMQRAIFPRNGYQEFISAAFLFSRYNVPFNTNPAAVPYADTVAVIGGSGIFADVHVNWLFYQYSLPYQLQIDWIAVQQPDLPAIAVNNIVFVNHSTAAVSSNIVSPNSGSLYGFASQSGGNVSSFDDKRIGLVYLDLTGEKLTTVTVNELLAFFVDKKTTNGSLLVSGQTPAAPPTGQGIVDAATLIARGWAVETD